ncbi:MAG TPA: hypothetical protein VFQ39_08665, partial [Longimicrobium sp.]|nr:hypothetical protein [Longimicrobium sp.]
CELLAVRVAPGLGEEARAVAEAMRSPGPLDAFTPGDTCPDNHSLAGGRIRFYDFEFSAFRPALLDAAYFRVPFPTCWCVSRVPGDLAARMDDAYRAAAAPAFPAIADEAFYRREMAHALACWLLVTLNFVPIAGLHLEGALAEDKPWGPVSLRQRHVHRLESFAATAEGWGRLPALAETARALAARLRERWPGAEMPDYAAFRGSSDLRF